MAREFDGAIDMHLDSGASAEELDTLLVCDLTEKYGWAGASPSGTSASSPPWAHRIRTRWRAGWPIQADGALQGRPADRDPRAGAPA